jgi:hypothetical protein
MGLHRLHYGDGFLWMMIVEIVGGVVESLGEEVEERVKRIDSLDVDWD